ncbi:MAG: hypothetical protein K0R02_698 [Rickettsiaceae bacterium]|jgi:uncharacterized membrane protein YbhN (UPF0104 family)|nr:hypothetical protein [Rickettsiaceae bacterium]
MKTNQTSNNVQLRNNKRVIFSVAWAIGTLLLTTDNAFAAWSAPDLDGGFKAGFKPIVKLITDYSIAGVAVSAIGGMFLAGSQGADMRTRGGAAAVGALIGSMVIWGLGKAVGLEALSA